MNSAVRRKSFLRHVASPLAAEIHLLLWREQRWWRRGSGKDDRFGLNDSLTLLNDSRVISCGLRNGLLASAWSGDLQAGYLFRTLWLAQAKDDWQPTLRAIA